MIIFIDTLSEMPLFRHLNNVKINIEQIKIKSWSGNNVEVRCVGDMALFSAVVDFSGVFCCYGIVFGYYYGIEFGCYAIEFDYWANPCKCQPVNLPIGDSF